MARSARPEPATVEITDLSHDGRGVGRVDGKTWFVDGALPGETVVAKVVRRQRRFDKATTLEVLQASPDRVVPRCAAFGTCGGCVMQHLDIAAQRDAKRSTLAENLRSIGGLEPEAWLEDLTAAEWAYRRRARLGVKYVTKKGRVLVGFRERNAPYVADMERCEILTDPVGGLLTALAALVENLSIREFLPQIEVATGDDQTVLVLRILRELDGDDRVLLRQFASDHGITFYLQPGGLDTIVPLHESAALSYTMREFDVTIHFSPVDFIQVHGELNERMIALAIDLLEVQAGDRVLDLFCGLGNFTLPLARRAASVTGVEGDAALVDRARENARHNGIANVDFHVADLFTDAAGGTWPTTGYDLAVLDPPRSGAREVLATLAASGVRRIVYVSCHPATLARDAGELCKEHGFKLLRAGIMDMFPHTAHVESIAVFAAPSAQPHRDER